MSNIYFFVTHKNKKNRNRVRLGRVKSERVFQKTQISQILSLRSPEFLEQLGFDGEPYGSYGEDDPRDESTKPGGENSPLEDLPEHILEGAVLWTHSGDARRQSHGARPPRRNLRRQPKADSLHVSHFEDAPDPA